MKEYYNDFYDYSSKSIVYDLYNKLLYLVSDFPVALLTKYNNVFISELKTLKLQEELELK